MSRPTAITNAPDACTLLTADQVSEALEVPSQAGQHMLANNTTACVWSNEVKYSMSDRRVTLTILLGPGFDAGKTLAAPAPGVGDDAYYELYGTRTPILMVRKGQVAFSLRVLNGNNFKQFTFEQQKAKEAALGMDGAKAL